MVGKFKRSTYRWFGARKQFVDNPEFMYEFLHFFHLWESLPAFVLATISMF
jgi:hypothetical protein